MLGSTDRDKGSGRRTGIKGSAMDAIAKHGCVRPLQPARTGVSKPIRAEDFAADRQIAVVGNGHVQESMP